jgi:hypothetical protein
MSRQARSRQPTPKGLDARPHSDRTPGARVHPPAAWLATTSVSPPSTRPMPHDVTYEAWAWGGRGDGAEGGGVCKPRVRSARRQQKDMSC